MIQEKNGKISLYDGHKLLANTVIWGDTVFLTKEWDTNELWQKMVYDFLNNQNFITTDSQHMNVETTIEGINGALNSGAKYNGKFYKFIYQTGYMSY